MSITMTVRAPRRNPSYQDGKKARCVVTEYTNGAGRRRFVAQGDWWQRCGFTRREARTAWRAARRNGEP